MQDICATCGKTEDGNVIQHSDPEAVNSHPFTVDPHTCHYCGIEVRWSGAYGNWMSNTGVAETVTAECPKATITGRHAPVIRVDTRARVR